MFSSLRTSTLAQRALGALELTRSFLLLEDDYAVDWEVDGDELPSVHPHRAPLRAPWGAREPHARRPGRARTQHFCLTPIFKGEPGGRGNAAGAREASALARRGSHPEGHPRPARPDTRAGRHRP